MQAVGIICEYNPFHNGHLYHLKKVKELFPNHLIILVLNGYFLERGEISIISKKDKTQLALLNGIDIVIELPFVFGTQSADVFANISITMLEKFNCEYVIFGSESNNLEVLNNLVTQMTSNKEEYNKEVKKYLDTGLNYPTALAKALNCTFDFKANDLLGISYLKSIRENNFKIKPLTIKRTNEYLNITSNDDIISAQNIRNKIQNKVDIKKYVPKSTLKYLNKVSLDDYFKLLKYTIITDKDLNRYLDVDEGIENRLKKVISEVKTLDELILKIKSKRYTYNKIKRMLVHILIGLTKEDNQKLKLEYIKVLGFNKKGQEYLNELKKDINIPLISLKDSLTFSYEMKATLIYDLITNSNNYSFENSNKPLI